MSQNLQPIIAHESTHAQQKLLEVERVSHFWAKLEEYLSNPQSFTLCKIPTGATVNHTPIYRQTGGHMYGNPNGVETCQAQNNFGDEFLTQYYNLVSRLKINHIDSGITINRSSYMNPDDLNYRCSDKDDPYLY